MGNKLNLQEVSGSNFDLQSLDLSTPEIRANAKCSILLVKANWCGHCNAFFPKFEKISAKYKKVNFLFLEEEDNQTVLTQWENLQKPAFTVKFFPTVVMYDSNGDPIDVIERENLEQEIQKYI